MDNSDADQRLEHHQQPAEFVSLEELFAKTGVEYFEVRRTFTECAAEFFARALSFWSLSIMMSYSVF